MSKIITCIEGNTIYKYNLETKRMSYMYNISAVIDCSHDFKWGSIIKLGTYGPQQRICIKCNQEEWMRLKKDEEQDPELINQLRPPCPNKTPNVVSKEELINDRVTLSDLGLMKKYNPSYEYLSLVDFLEKVKEND